MKFVELVWHKHTFLYHSRLAKCLHYGIRIYKLDYKPSSLTLELFSVVSRKSSLLFWFPGLVIVQYRCQFLAAVVTLC